MDRQQLINLHNSTAARAEQTGKSTEHVLSQQNMLKETKEKFLASAAEHNETIATLSVALKDNKEAMAILNTVKDMNTAQSYAFIEHNLNIALEKVFNGSVRRIRLVEGVYSGKYPELKLELITENGVKRSLKTDSGHGMRQVVSLLCTLCLICVSGARRFLVLDEVLTGLSAESKKAVDDILWAFAGIGFQFLIVEHGFVARNAQVYELKLENGISRVTHEYITSEGHYRGIAPKNSTSTNNFTEFAEAAGTEETDGQADEQPNIDGAAVPPDPFAQTYVI